MAKPKIFISSTFYDLKQIRYDLESFFKTLGYDCVMNDRGHIPYSKEFTLEQSCFEEATRVDILIGIIGGRYGTQAKGEDIFSVSMKEINTAIKNNKQVYVCVDKSVLSENKLYIENKSNNVKYVAVDNVKIHSFIEEIKNLQFAIPVIPFESAAEIIDFLKEQFAGLFQKLLNDRTVASEQTTYADLKAITSELRETIAKRNIMDIDFYQKFDTTYFNYNLALANIRKHLGLKDFFIVATTKKAISEMFKHLGYNESEDDDSFLYIEKDDYGKRFIISKKLFEGDKIRIVKDAAEAKSLIMFENDDDLPF